MSFLKWISKRNRDYKKWVAYRRKYLAEYVFEFVEDRHRREIPNSRWVYAMSENDIKDLTGEDLRIGDHTIYESHKGPVRLNCVMLGDRRPMRYDSKTDPSLDRLG